MWSEGLEEIERDRERLHHAFEDPGTAPGEVVCRLQASDTDVTLDERVDQVSLQ